MFIRSMRRYFCCQSNIESSKTLSKLNLSVPFMKGAFGAIYLQEGDNPFVIKKIRRCFYHEDEFIVGYNNTFSNIIKYKNIIRKKNFYYLFMDYYKNGDMLDYLKEKKKFNINMTKKYTKQMLECIKNLNSMGYVHLDIKLDNFFLDDNMNLVLADLGCCHDILNNDNKLVMLDRIVGTKSYSPHEIFNEDYGNKSDVWSVGVCVYSMLTGESLEVNLEDIFSFKKIQLDEFSHETNDFLNKLLCPNYRKRLTVEEALSHKFFDIS